MKPVRLAAIVAASGLLVVVGLLVALSRYAPLEVGSSSGIVAEGMERRTDLSGEQTAAFPYRRGGEVEIRQAVRNAGRLAIELDGIQWPSTRGPLELVHTGPSRRLDPGEETELILVLRMGGKCPPAMGANSSLTVPIIRVQYRVLGRHRSQEVALAEPFQVSFVDGLDPGPNCPPTTG